MLCYVMSVFSRDHFHREAESLKKDDENEKV